MILFLAAILVAISTITALKAQEFQQDVDSIPVLLKGTTVHSPFAGGFSVTNPAMTDIDNDGDLDLFVGEFEGGITFLRNTGTESHPIFTMESENLLGQNFGIDITPTFADIDGDGDMDLFFGENEGSIRFFRNVGSPSDHDFHLEANNFVGIDVGGDSAPTFADIDGDGDLDLFVGENGGNINFYRNRGTTENPNFSLAAEFFAAIAVGFDSHPYFADVDNDGDLDLFVGEDAGNLNFYRNVGSATNGLFSPETENFAALVEFDSAPLFADLDADGDLDLVVGDNSGNVNYYQNTGNVTNPFYTQLTNNFVSIDVGSFSTPTFADMNGDGMWDLFLGEQDGNMHYYRNSGTMGNPQFTLETANFAALDIGAASAPAFVDIDGDGDLDLFVGEDAGNINFYRNTGSTVQPNLILVTERFAAIDVGQFGTPAFVDIENDGDYDLFVGESGGHVHFYRNLGTAANPSLTQVTSDFANIDVGDFSTPAFVDIDNDGDFDLFVGDSFGKLHFYRNSGTATEAHFALETNAFFGIDVGEYSFPAFMDIDHDENPDLFIGNEAGGIYFYRNSTPTGVSASQIDGIPRSFSLSQNFPNPFNPETTIEYQLPKRAEVRLVIYNLLGQKMATLINETQSAGSYSLKWDGRDDAGTALASGIYFYKLRAPESTKTRKLVLVR